MSVWQLIVCLSVLWVGPAWGQVYKWTDRQNNVHFTDNPSRIPLEYRSNVEIEHVGTPAPSPTPSDATASSAPPSDAPPTDRLGRGPEHWQQLAQQWSIRLQRHSAERDRLQLLYHYTRNLASTTRDASDRSRRHAETIRLEKAIAEIEAQMKEAESMLSTTLPLEARRLGANPDWLKPPTAMQP
jgi:Domain of unknown function (DUF4124)